MDAAAAGAAEGSNPYAKGTDEHNDWARGFSSTEQTDVFKEGVEAYGRGAPRDDCPYPDGTGAAEEWKDGWDEAEGYDTDEEVKDNL